MGFFWNVSQDQTSKFYQRMRETKLCVNWSHWFLSGISSKWQNLSLYINQILVTKKNPLHHLRGFARKNTSITGKIYEKIEWRTFNYRVHNSNQLHNKLDFLSWMHSCKARPWLVYPRLKVKRFNTWVMQISIKAPSSLWLYGAQLNYLLG